MNGVIEKAIVYEIDIGGYWHELSVAALLSSSVTTNAERRSQSFLVRLRQLTVY